MRVEDIQKFITELGIPNTYAGKPGLEVQTFCPLRNLKDHAITWVRNIEDISLSVFDGYEGILIVADIEQQKPMDGMDILWADNPHRTFFKILEQFFSEIDPENVGTGIESTAVVETSDYGEDIYIGHHCYIGKDVHIGNKVKIHHNVSIEGHVVIGDDTVIASGVRIGVCGYGHYQDFDGTNKCVPHLAGVRIGRNVRVGGNVCICRGCLDDTVIEDNVRINNLCHIAHNDRIKHDAMLTAGVIVCGSTTVGSETWLSPGSIITNGVTIGDGSQVGLGAVATKSLPENGVYIGLPAKKIRDRK